MQIFNNNHIQEMWQEMKGEILTGLVARRRLWWWAYTGAARLGLSKEHTGGLRGVRL